MSLTLFHWVERAFWLIWAGLPLLIWMQVRAVLDLRDSLAEMVPESGACASEFPAIPDFSATGQAVYWVAFAVIQLYFVALLFLAHRAIRRCARGEIFVDTLASGLAILGIMVAVYPPLELALSNLVGLVFRNTGDMPAYRADLALDLPVMGFGLLLVVLAEAFRRAVALHRDAELTI